MTCPRSSFACISCDICINNRGGGMLVPGGLPDVAASANYIAGEAKHVTINDEAVLAAAQQLHAQLGTVLQHAAAFDTSLHYVDGGPLTAQYLLVVDALNFCFWPDGELEYEHLAGGLKARLEEDPSCLDAQRLANIQGPGVRALLGWNRDLPQQEERARLLREVGQGLLDHFQGSASKLVAAAGGSALRLVGLVAAHFPGFRDHAVYKGQQVFLYKRAQIFVADLYGAFGGVGLGAFSDISSLTMFADYRVPVVLRHMGVLTYSAGLAAKVDSKQELPAGSEEELEIRGCSIEAVERLKAAVQAVSRQETAGEGGTQPPAPLLSIQLDWWLWHQGEQARDTHPPHHRTWTIYY